MTVLILIVTALWTLALLAGVRHLIRRALPPVPAALARSGPRVVLALSAVLFAVGLGWGAAPHTWALDEVSPAEVIAGWQQGFAGGWHSAYPPFHFIALAVASLPALLAGGAGLVSLDAPEVLVGLLLVGRALSVAAALGVVAGTMRLAARLAEGPAVWIAGLSVATFLPLPFYAKTMNLDAPYLCWFVLSLVSYAAALSEGARRHVVAFAVFAALAVATKDQAYGLFVLPVVWLGWQQARRPRAMGSLGWAALAGAATFTLAHNLPFNPRGFALHLDALLGPASANYRMVPASPAGLLELGALTAGLVPWMLGWLGVAAVAVGVVQAWRGGALRAWPWLLLPMASYAVSFLAVVGYVYDRFLLPALVPAAILAGLGLAGLLAPRRGPRGSRVAGLVVLVLVLTRGLSVDALLVRDSRYAAEAWIEANVPADASIGVAQLLAYLPRLDDWSIVTVEPVVRESPAELPELLVVNTEHWTRYAPDSPRGRWLAWLESGTGPYVEVYRHKTAPPWWSAFRWWPRMTDRTEHPLTNLDKANPEIAVFELRAAGSGVGDAASGSGSH